MKRGSRNNFKIGALWKNIVLANMLMKTLSKEQWEAYA